MEKSDNAKVPLETALNKTGFGIYSYSYVLFTGVLIISYAFIAYGATILLPTSACELGTTSSQQGLIAAAPVVANMLGASPWGYLGDTRGRRKTLIVSLLAAAGVNLVGSLSVNWIMLLIMIFLATFIASGQYSLSMTLLSENLPIAKRSIMLLMVSSIFLLSQGVMAVIAIPIIPLKFSYEIPFLGIYWNSWRLLMLIYSLPSILTAGWLYFMTASPKFALSKGNEEGALEILRTIHRRNGVKEDFQVKSLLSETQKDGGDKPSMKDQIVPLFKAPLLKNTIIVTTLFLFQQVISIQVWFPTIANQFMKMIDEGAELNQTLCSVIRLGLDTPPDPDAEPCSLNNTAMLIVLATASLQSVVNGIVSLGVNSFGRRNIVIVVCAVCGLSGVLVNLVPNTIASAALFVTFLLGIMVIGLYTAIAVTIFPTHLRALAVGLTMSGARIGSIISVQVLNFLFVTNCDAGFYIFASLFASSAIVASFLPDDRKLMKQAQQASKSAREENTKL